MFMLQKKLFSFSVIPFAHSISSICLFSKVARLCIRCLGSKKLTIPLSLSVVKVSRS